MTATGWAGIHASGRSIRWRLAVHPETRESHCGEVRKSAIVIDMQVSQHDSRHVVRRNAQRTQLRAEFLVGRDSESDFPAHVGMQRRGGLEEMSPLTRVHHDHAFRMLDDPSVSRKPFSPMRVCEYCEPPTQSYASPLDLRRLDPNEAGLDGVDLHARPTIDRTMSGWSK